MQFERAALEPVLDIRGALARLDGDEDLLIDLMGFFMEDSPRLMQQLEAAAKTRHTADVKMAAHSLKGLVAGCGGVRAAEAAKRVEHAALANDLSHVDELVACLARELEVVRGEAQGYLS